MAETNIGFDVNGGIGEGDWATISPFLGAAIPVVESDTSAAVTAGTTSMTVDVAAGVTYACGERHNITTVVNKSISAVALSGATRYDAIVRRRNWSTNSVTTEVIQGTAAVGAQKVPPTLNNNPGVLHDQLLALVKATYGSTALDISDMRIKASKFYTVPTVDALPAAASTPSATVAYVLATKTVYRNVLSSGALAWVSDSPAITELTGSSVWSASSANGWTIDGTHTNRCLTAPYWRQIDIEVRQSGAEINAANADGNFSDTPIGSFTATCFPDRTLVVPVLYLTTDGKTFTGTASLDPNGAFTLLTGAPARNLAKSTVAGTVSLFASIAFGRRTA